MTWQLHLQFRLKGSIISSSKIPLKHPRSHLPQKGNYSIPNPIHTYYLDNSFYIPKGSLRFGIRFRLCLLLRILNHTQTENVDTVEWSRYFTFIVTIRLVLFMFTRDFLFHLYRLFWLWFACIKIWFRIGGDSVFIFCNPCTHRWA